MAALLRDLEQVERVLTRAIASAFESCGEAWPDDTSGDRLAKVAARAVRQLVELVEAGVKLGGAPAAGPLTASEHREHAERLLSEASFQTHPGAHPAGRGGTEVPIEQLRLLVARAQVHALLAALPSASEDGQ